MKKENELSEELKIRIIDLSAPIADLEFLFTRKGVSCAPIGDIVVLKGKPKAGKSTLLVGWIAAFLDGEYLGFKATINDKTVLYIDTEQNAADTQKLTRKIHSLCGYPTDSSNHRLIVINLRGDNPKDRLKYILEAVEKFKPVLLIIDGAKDLIANGDINDPKSSHEVVQRLMTISKENHLAILTVLHENKNDPNLRGHIGTELLNKCSECWQIKKTGKIFDVEQTDSRHKPAEGFSFTLDEKEQPVFNANASKISGQERTDIKMINTFKQCLPREAKLIYTELTKVYCEKYPCKESLAHSHIAKGTKLAVLIKESDKNYKFNY